MYISDWISMIVAAFLPRSVKYYAMLDWVEWYPLEAWEIDCPRYKARMVKESK